MALSDLSCELYDSEPSMIFVIFFYIFLIRSIVKKLKLIFCLLA